MVLKACLLEPLRQHQITTGDALHLRFRDRKAKQRERATWLQASSVVVFHAADDYDDNCLHG
jgi:hypothetical protein